MDPKQIAKQMIQFNKTTFDNTFDAITILQEQTEKLIGKYLEQAPMIPAEGKKAIADWMKAYKKSREEFKAVVDEKYNLPDMISAAPSETVEEPKAVKAAPEKKAEMKPKAANPLPAIKEPKAVKEIPAIKEPKAAKPRPAKKVKRTAKKKPRKKKLTNIDMIVRLIKGSADGISTAELKDKTGLPESQIWNIVNRVSKLGKVKKVKRGVYGAV
jgi:polyhydroxyalkanoate synthesis regulator phasin